jgi:hypothetical protein
MGLNWFRTGFQLQSYKSANYIYLKLSNTHEVISPKNLKRGKWKGGILGWIIFVLGIIALVLGAYSRIGYWVCLLIAVSWFVSLHQNSAKKRRQKELLNRVEKIGSGP